MRARPTKNAQAVTIALVVAVGVVVTTSCRQSRPAIDGSRLDIKLTAADSPKEIENNIRASVAKKYGPEDMTASYKMHQVTNGPTRWAFVQAYNAPRGLAMFNLYCYEQEKADNWLLRAYVPVNAYYFTNGSDRELHIETDNDYINVAFRGVVIFTGLAGVKLFL